MMRTAVVGIMMRLLFCCSWVLAQPTIRPVHTVRPTHVDNARRSHPPHPSSLLVPSLYDLAGTVKPRSPPHWHRTWARQQASAVPTSTRHRARAPAHARQRRAPGSRTASAGEAPRGAPGCWRGQERGEPAPPSVTRGSRSSRGAVEDRGPVGRRSVGGRSGGSQRSLDAACAPHIAGIRSQANGHGRAVESEAIRSNQSKALGSTLASPRMWRRATWR